MLARNIYKFKDRLCCHFSKYKYYYLIFCLFLVLGIVSGIIRSTKLTTASYPKIIKLKTLREFITGGKKPSSYIFSRFFSDVLIFAAIALACSFIYSAPLTVVIVFVRGYTLGLYISLCAALLGAGAAVFIWVVIFPLEIFVCFFLCSFGAMTCSFCVSYSKYGARGNAFLRNLRKAGIALAAAFVVYLVQLVILVFFNNTFILSY